MSKVRKQNKESFWRAHIQRKEQLGLSANAYCQQQGLVTAQMHYWQQKLMDLPEAAMAQTPSGFAEVQVVDNPYSEDPRPPSGRPDPQWVAEFLVHFWRCQ